MSENAKELYEYLIDCGYDSDGNIISLVDKWEKTGLLLATEKRNRPELAKYLQLSVDNTINDIYKLNLKYITLLLPILVRCFIGLKDKSKFDFINIEKYIIECIENIITDDRIENSNIAFENNFCLFISDIIINHYEPVA